MKFTGRKEIYIEISPEHPPVAVVHDLTLVVRPVHPDPERAGIFQLIVNPNLIDYDAKRWTEGGLVQQIVEYVETDETLVLDFNAQSGGPCEADFEIDGTRYRIESYGVGCQKVLKTATGPLLSMFGEWWRTYRFLVQWKGPGE